MLGRNHDQESSRGEEEDEIFMDALSGSNRERLGNKRGREVDGEGEMDSSEPHRNTSCSLPECAEPGQQSK